MDIRLIHCYVYYISCCVFILPYLEAKSVSLNDIIAAEQRSFPHTTTSRSILYTSTGTAITQGRKPSALKYRQTYEIKSPSRPKKFKLSLIPLYKRKKLTTKREIDQNDKIIVQKYIPLLKNLRLFFDNILGSDSNESYEPRGQKYKRNPFITNERDDIVCTCERKSDSGPKSHPQETNTLATPISTEIEDKNVAVTTTTTTPTYLIVNDNIRGVGRHPNVPVLFTRNSTGIRRNDSGLGQGSSPSFHGSFERHISRDYGNYEHNTRRETESYTENYEEYSDSYPRNDASRNKSGEHQRHRTDSGNSEDYRGATNLDESAVPRNETLEVFAGHILEHERQIEYQIRGHETESSLSLQEFDSRLRGFDSQEKDTTIHRTKTSKKSTTQISTSDKRITNRNGAHTSENQGISTTYKAIEPRHVLPNATFPAGKVVMIFDGYSVAKDVNGDNKITEKAVHIHN